MVNEVITLYPNTEEDVKLIEYLAKSLNVIYDIEPKDGKNGTRKKPSDYIGTLSPELAEEFHEYVKKSREEWDRDI